MRNFLTHVALTSLYLAICPLGCTTQKETAKKTSPTAATPTKDKAQTAVKPAAVKMPSSPSDRLAEPSRFVTDIRQAEGAAHLDRYTVYQALCSGLLKKEPARIKAALAPSFSGWFPGKSLAGKLGSGGFKIRTFDTAKTPILAEQFAKSWAQLGRLATVRTCRTSIDSAKLIDGQQVWSKARITVNGETVPGMKTGLRINVTAHSVGTGAERRFTALRVDSMTRVDGLRPLFVDVTHQLGMDLGRSRNARAVTRARLDARAIQNMGGVSVIDFDKDGRDDLMAWNWHRTLQIFVNDGAGGFHRIANPIAPNQVGFFQLYIDLDGDGREELVSTNINDCRNGVAQLGLFVRGPKRFVPKSRALTFKVKCQLPSRLLFQHIEPVDVNGDGRVDLVFSGFSNGQSKGAKFNLYRSSAGERNLIFINQGNLKFDEQGTDRGLTHTGFTYAAAAFDYDEDGDSDLYFTNDFGPNRLYRNNGTGHFEIVDSPLGQTGHATGLLIADIDSDGDQDVMTLGNRSSVAMRLAPLFRSRLTADKHRALLAIGSGNRVYLNNGKGAYQENAETLNLRGHGSAWGAVHFDADLDGRMDLGILNGTISHSNPKAPDYATYFWRQLLDDVRATQEKVKPESKLDEKDRDEAAQFVGSFDGYQSNALYINNAGRFVNIGSPSGFHSVDDGRALASFDMDGDGDLDLVTLSLQGLKVFQNRTPPSQTNWLEVSVLTPEGNPSLGARVTVKTSRRTSMQVVRLTNGFHTQRSPRLSFGLGKDKVASTVTVTWPSGKKNSFSNLSGRVVVGADGRLTKEKKLTWSSSTQPGLIAHQDMSVSLKNPRGQTVTIPGGDRRPTVVNVWSTKAPTSPQEITVLNRLASEFGSRVHLVGVSANGDVRSDLAREAKAMGITYEVVRANDDFATHFFGNRSTLTLPATFVFDGHGRLRRAFRRTISGSDIKRALDTGRTTGQDHLDQAMVAAAAKKFGRVRIHLAQAVKLEPASPVAWWRLGRLEAQEKHWPGAAAALRKSLSLAPDSLSTMTDLGHTYLMLDKADEAIRLFQTVSDREDSAVALLNLAKAYGKAGQMDKASETIEFAREKDPELLKALQTRMKTQAQEMQNGDQKGGLQPSPQAPWPSRLQPQAP